MSDASLVCTTFNEEDNISSLLSSIEDQTTMPSEFVVVDAGSTDDTVDIINKWGKKSEISVKIYIAEGYNIPEGRNLAITKSNGDIIAVTDAGVTLDESWFENITAPIENSGVDVVSGYYVPQTDTLFKKLAARFSYTPLEQINQENFLPSSRSIAFTRESWADIGGYPESVDIGEDTLFDIKLKESGKEFEFEDGAVVYWEHSINTEDFVRRTVRYSFWDGYLNIPQDRYRIIVRVFTASVIILYSIRSKNMKLLTVPCIAVLLMGARDYKIVRELESEQYQPALLEFIILVMLRILYEVTNTFAYLFGSAKRIANKLIK